MVNPGVIFAFHQTLAETLVAQFPNRWGAVLEEYGVGRDSDIWEARPSPNDIDLLRMQLRRSDPLVIAQLAEWLGVPNPLKERPALDDQPVVEAPLLTVMVPAALSNADERAHLVRELRAAAQGLRADASEGFELATVDEFAARPLLDAAEAIENLPSDGSGWEGARERVQQDLWLVARFSRLAHWMNNSGGIAGWISSAMMAAQVLVA